MVSLGIFFRFWSNFFFKLLEKFCHIENIKTVYFCEPQWNKHFIKYFDSFLQWPLEPQLHFSLSFNFIPTEFN